MRVFELPEGELGLGLGPVPGDDVGGGPVVMIGDQHGLAEQFLFQGGADVSVDAPCQPQVCGFLAVQLPGGHAAHPGLADDGGDRVRPGPEGSQAAGATALDAAGATASMRLGHDLLHTHLGSWSGGTRWGRSECAPVITSFPVARAVLFEVGGWVRQIAPYASHAAVTGLRTTAGRRRGVAVAGQWLSALAWAIDTAHDTQPVRAAELHQENP